MCGVSFYFIINFEVTCISYPQTDEVTSTKMLKMYYGIMQFKFWLP